MQHHNSRSELHLQSPEDVLNHTLHTDLTDYHLVLAEDFQMKIFSVFLCFSLAFWEKTSEEREW